MSSDFAFPPETIGFLRDLSANNEKAWFDANRGRYDAGYVEAGKEFVVAATPLLDKIAPGICAEPRINGSIFRINRDLRFSKDKTPYKDHLDFWFWHGLRKGAVTGLFARIAPQGVWVGAGAHSFSRDVLASYRRAVDADETSLRTIVDGLTRAGYSVSDREGSPDDPVAARLARCKALFTVVEEPVALATDAKRLLPRLAEHWEAMAPLHLWLALRVQGTQARITMKPGSS